jgi:endonuclease/exonuclease/phosphatase family metal-dependent hydrolase
VVVGDFNTPLSSTNWYVIQIKIQILELNDMIDLMDLTGVYRVLHTARAQYTFCSAGHRTFSKIDRILGHKASFIRYKETEINPCILSDHNTIKLEFKSKRNKSLNNTLLYDELVIEKIKVQSD